MSDFGPRIWRCAVRGARCAVKRFWLFEDSTGCPGEFELVVLRAHSFARALDFEDFWVFTCRLGGD